MKCPICGCEHPKPPEEFIPGLHVALWTCVAAVFVTIVYFILR